MDSGIGGIMSVQIKGAGTIGGIDQGLNVVGVVTATEFNPGIGSAVGTTGLESHILKTQEAFTIGAGTSVNITSQDVFGNVAYTKLDRINVATGATFHVSTGTTFVMNVLGVF